MDLSYQLYHKPFGFLVFFLIYRNTNDTDWLIPYVLQKIKSSVTRTWWIRRYVADNVYIRSPATRVFQCTTSTGREQVVCKDSESIACCQGSQSIMTTSCTRHHLIGYQVSHFGEKVFHQFGTHSCWAPTNKCQPSETQVWFVLISMILFSQVESLWRLMGFHPHLSISIKRHRLTLTLMFGVNGP